MLTVFASQASLLLQNALLLDSLRRETSRSGRRRPRASTAISAGRGLEDEIRRGAFREDLYYRLNVVSIALPPLRERGEDLVVLARWFLQRYAKEFGSRVRGYRRPSSGCGGDGGGRGSKPPAAASSPAAPR